MRYGLIADWRRLLRLHWRAGALLFTVVAALGCSLVLLSRPVYRAESRLRLGDPPPMSGVSPNAGLFSLLQMGGDPFANDLELLASRTLAERVVDDAALNVRLDAPRGWHRDSLLVSLTAGRNTREGSFTVVWTDAGIEVTPDAETGVTRPVRGAPGETMRFGEVSAVFEPWRTGMPREVVLKTVPHAQAARELGEQIEVERTRRDANVIQVRFEHTDPQLARHVVGAMVSRFIALRTQLMQRESGETVDSLRGVAVRTQQELAAAETSLEQLQRTTGLIAPEAQAEVSIERYAELLGTLETARMELSALEQALARSTAMEDAAGSWAALLAYPRFLANSTIGDMLATLTELEQQRRELAGRRTPDNRELRVVTDQIAHLDRSLRTVAADFATTLTAEVRNLERRTAALRAELAAVPASTIELGRRTRDLRIFSEMVVLTEQRLRQEELRQALTFANVQVIDPPALRDRPVWPRLKLGTLIALLLAAATAVFGVIVMDRADTTVRSAEQVRLAIDAPAIAAVVADGRGAPVMRSEDAAAVIRRSLVEPGGVARLLVLDAPDGSCAELVARALSAAHDEAEELARPAVDVLPGSASFGTAAAAAARRLPVFIAVEIGGTTEPSLRRLAELLRQADADIAGAVLVCRSRADAAEVWV